MIIGMGAALRSYLVLLVVVFLVLGVIISMPHTAHTSPQTHGTISTYTTVNSMPQLPFNVTAYVVGSESFVESVVIHNLVTRVVGYMEVPSIPPHSIVILDWDYLVTEHANTTGIAMDLFRNNDLIIAYTDNDTYYVAYALARAWALAYGVKFIAVPGAVRGPGFVAVFGNAHNLLFTNYRKPTGIVGAITKYIQLEQIWQTQQQETTLSLAPIRALLQSGTSPTDPCYTYAEQYKSYGVLFDYQPLYGGQNLVAYSDGNGTFEYDTCIFVVNGVNQPSGGYPWIGINPAVWIGYVPSNTMVNNGGYINYYIGTIDHEMGYHDYEGGVTNSFTEYVSGASPSSTSGSYVQEFSVFFGGGLNYMLPYSESPGYVEINYENTGGDTPATFNNTWTFDFSQASVNQLFQVAYTEDQVEWGLPQGINTPQSAALYNEFGVDLVTSVQDIPCTAWVYTYEYVWVNFQWTLYYNPGQTPTYSATTFQSTSDPYITGITSYTQYIPYICGDAT